MVPAWSSRISQIKEGSMMSVKRRKHLAGTVFLLLSLAGADAIAGTEGTSSTFYGGGAGNSNSGGGLAGYNSFFGVQAGYSNTTGYQNSFFGSGAGASNLTGQYNSFFGFSAGLYSTGSQNTFLGNYAGAANTTGGQNVFVGDIAGNATTSGGKNTFLGQQSGYANTTGFSNTYLGQDAGRSNVSGFGNVFVGAGAGFSELGSERLYIDNCDGGVCTTPFIYGEFDNHLLKINGVINVAANGAAKSQMHFSLDNGDYGGFLTSVLPNNFFISSGARYDSPNWVQRSADGNAVMAGSGGVGYRIFTHTGTTVGNTFNNPTLRLQIDYSGQFGINTAPVAGDEIHTSSGAHLTSGGVWTDASSREYKENVKPLTTEQAMQAVAQLVPVTYNYKADSEEKHVGFIAEDVPELVATKDRRSLSPMDIVAALTKVVQEKSQIVDAQRATLDEQQRALESVVAELMKLRLDVAQLKDRTSSVSP
jgi:hypothetical protein